MKMTSAIEHLLLLTINHQQLYNLFTAAGASLMYFPGGKPMPADQASYVYR
jgi:hypothetical protein